jgi:hypothetical protein
LKNTRVPSAEEVKQQSTGLPRATGAVTFGSWLAAALEQASSDARTAITSDQCARVRVFEIGASSATSGDI